MANARMLMKRDQVNSQIAEHNQQTEYDQRESPLSLMVIIYKDTRDRLMLVYTLSLDITIQLSLKGLEFTVLSTPPLSQYPPPPYLLCDDYLAVVLYFPLGPPVWSDELMEGMHALQAVRRQELCVLTSVARPGLSL